jgi:hypothetical protein
MIFPPSEAFNGCLQQQRSQTYFSNFFHRLICAATFFGDGAPTVGVRQE